jgi:hypothetical protein
MADYKCKDCGETRSLYKRTMVMRDGKLVTKQAECDCGTFMDQVMTEEYEGIPDIQRNELNTGHNSGG